MIQTQPSYTDILANFQRLEVLRELALIDSEEEVVFDRFTQFASAAIGAPISLVSMVAADYQFLKSGVGLPEELRSERQTPLSHSFCQHVVGTGKALIIADAREDAVLKTNMAITDFNVIGYLGVPLARGDHNLGSFCVIDDEPREWNDEEIALVTALATLVNREIELRARALARDELDEHIMESDKRFDGLFAELDPRMPKAEIIKKVKAYQRQMIGL